MLVPACDGTLLVIVLKLVRVLHVLLLFLMMFPFGDSPLPRRGVCMYRRDLEYVKLTK